MNGAPSMAGSSARGASEASAGSDESEVARPNTRAKGKRSLGGPATGTRRKADDAVAKAPSNKKTKTNGGAASSVDYDHSDDDQYNDKGGKDEGNNSKSKMTDEEKRKNFLERNRYVLNLDFST